MLGVTVPLRQSPYFVPPCIPSKLWGYFRHFLSKLGSTVGAIASTHPELDVTGKIRFPLELTIFGYCLIARGHQR